MTIQSSIFNPSVMNRSKRFVTIDGKDYVVKRTSYKNPLTPSTMPMYEEAVVIDGTKHYVSKVPTIISKDGSKDVVVINGKTYDVKQSDDIMSTIRSAISKIHK